MPGSIEQGLPSKPLWPERIYTLPETRYPVRLNAARELLDVHAEGDRGGRLLMRLPTCPEFIITWLACQKLGAIAVPTMPLLRARELSAVANDAGTAAAGGAATRGGGPGRAAARGPAP